MANIAVRSYLSLISAPLIRQTITVVSTAELVTTVPATVAFVSAGEFLSKSARARVNVFHAGAWHAVPAKVYRGGQWTDRVDARVFINGKWVTL